MIRGEHRGVVSVILLGIITCGLYTIWWQYTIGKEINTALGEEAVSPILAVVAILCFPLMYYYVYTIDQALVKLGRKCGVRYESNFVLWIITMLLGIGYIIQIVQAQSYLNEVWASQ